MEYQLENENFIFIINNQQFGYVACNFENNHININKVFVDDQFRGQGLAKLMLDDIYKYADENKLEIVPICSYAVAYNERVSNEKNA